jgi:hypothetical protein
MNSRVNAVSGFSQGGSALGNPPKPMDSHAVLSSGRLASGVSESRRAVLTDSVQFGLDLKRGLIPHYHIDLQDSDLVYEEPHWFPSEQLAKRIREMLTRNPENLDDPEHGGWAFVTGLERYFLTMDERKEFLINLMARITGLSKKQLSNQVEIISRPIGTPRPHFDYGGHHMDSDLVALSYEPAENVQPGTGLPRVTDAANAVVQLSEENPFKHFLTKLFPDKEPRRRRTPSSSQVRHFLDCYRIHHNDLPPRMKRFTYTIPEFDNTQPALLILNNNNSIGIAHSGSAVSPIVLCEKIVRTILRLVTPEHPLSD